MRTVLLSELAWAPLTDSLSPLLDLIALFALATAKLTAKHISYVLARGCLESKRDEFIDVSALLSLHGDRAEPRDGRGPPAHGETSSPFVPWRNAWHFYVVGFLYDCGFLKLFVWVQIIESDVCILLVYFRFCLFFNSCIFRVWVYM